MLTKDQEGPAEKSIACDLHSLSFPKENEEKCKSLAFFCFLHYKSKALLDSVTALTFVLLP